MFSLSKTFDEPSYYQMNFENTTSSLQKNPFFFARGVHRLGSNASFFYWKNITLNLAW